jgi:hypothetical protein
MVAPHRNPSLAASIAASEGGNRPRNERGYP